MIQQISETLEKRELIKIHILQNNFDDKKRFSSNSISTNAK